MVYLLNLFISAISSASYYKDILLKGNSPAFFWLRVVHHDAELDQIVGCCERSKTKTIIRNHTSPIGFPRSMVCHTVLLILTMKTWVHRPVPSMLPDFHNGSSSSVQRKLWPRYDRGTNCILPLLTDALGTLMSAHLCDWTVPKCPKTDHTLLAHYNTLFDTFLKYTIHPSLHTYLSKCVACTSWRNAPTASVIRIGPEQIAHGTFVWHLLKSVQCSNVIKRIDRWTKPSVQAEYLSIYQSRQRQVVEQIRKKLPYIRIAVLPQTFVVETVNLRNLPRLVITAKDRNSFAISYLRKTRSYWATASSNQVWYAQRPCLPSVLPTELRFLPNNSHDRRNRPWTDS